MPPYFTMSDMYASIKLYDANKKLRLALEIPIDFNRTRLIKYVKMFGVQLFKKDVADQMREEIEDAPDFEEPFTNAEYEEARAWYCNNWGSDEDFEELPFEEIVELMREKRNELEEFYEKEARKEIEELMKELNEINEELNLWVADLTPQISYHDMKK